MSLNAYDRARYSRQILLEEWGEEGQTRINSASVFIAGAGGLGSPVAMYLAAAGVGEIRICDGDVVELSNLNRQILHNDDRVGALKAESAGRTLRALNPTIRVVTFGETLDESNVERMIGSADILVDCLDNYETRYLLNDFSIQRHVPLVHGAIWGLMGQVSFLNPPETACLQCLVPSPPAFGTFPVVGATPGVIGSLQAIEVLKYLTSIGTNLRGTLLIVDGEDMSFTRLSITPNRYCPACGNAPEDRSIQD